MTLIPESFNKQKKLNSFIIKSVLSEGAFSDNSDVLSPHVTWDMSNSNLIQQRKISTIGAPFVVPFHRAPTPMPIFYKSTSSFSLPIRTYTEPFATYEHVTKYEPIATHEPGCFPFHLVYYLKDNLFASLNSCKAYFAKIL